MYKDNNFTLYPGRKYVVGGTDTCDIYLEELPEKVVVKVKNDVVVIDNKEYSFGSYNVKVNQIVFKLVILKPEKYYLVDKNNIIHENEKLSASEEYPLVIEKGMKWNTKEYQDLMDYIKNK